jgi:hypothetical protein
VPFKTLEGEGSNKVPTLWKGVNHPIFETRRTNKNGKQNENKDVKKKTKEKKPRKEIFS